MKHKEGYYTIMEMDMRTGKSKKIGYHKITLDDKIQSWYTNHHFLTNFGGSLLFMISISLFYQGLFILSIFLMIISIINYYLIFTRQGVVD